jgi:hypothetical protein
VPLRITSGVAVLSVTATVVMESGINLSQFLISILESALTLQNAPIVS